MSKKVELKIDERVLEFKNNLYEKSLEHLKTTIPQRIIEFQKMAETLSYEALFSDSNGDANVTDKKRKLDCDTVSTMSVEELAKTNSAILEQQKKLKRNYMELVQTFSVIRCWITLNIPKIEDGNNFGVDVQEEVVSQLTKLEDVYTNLLEQSENYFINRAATVKKALKHRDIDSYKHAIIQQDEKERIRFYFAYFDLANNYATTYSLIVKNFQKIETPRPQSSSSINIY
ncbi:proteasome activator complex subunit 3 [Heterostelium album PN500]|uniref:Proteasome activator complex subunit 3 n=1 Tax=Heterostelium pallidum (strain ATCC 26659 / Pp 5 / PN500) TaxID=670386 RepID=D3B477_HETP5|nr:proteasome activator complex subunit 3 [Heterostelium album PN500]EFA84125.1 proteasome activator complex subunit 3 [Heterostelium album PN500]|eukprot:XP_020436242.1 proteasome activator complex subunit 3 [Heterostelium album PN500]